MKEIVRPGEKFGGAVLTEDGANEVNAHRINVDQGKKRPVICKMISNLDVAN
jgi:hypothetical protein